MDQGIKLEESRRRERAFSAENKIVRWHPVSQIKRLDSCTDSASAAWTRSPRHGVPRASSGPTRPRLRPACSPAGPLLLLLVLLPSPPPPLSSSFFLHLSSFPPPASSPASFLPLLLPLPPAPPRHPCEQKPALENAPSSHARGHQPQAHGVAGSSQAGPPRPASAAEAFSCPHPYSLRIAATLISGI